MFWPFGTGRSGGGGAEAVGAGPASRAVVAVDAVGVGSGFFFSSLLSHAKRASKMGRTQNDDDHVRMSEPISTKRRRYRSASACGCLIGVLSFADNAKAEDSTAAPAALTTATMQCERAAEPGRVKCSIELHAAAGRTIAWADVAILELPEFASALKGRIGAADATIREPTTQKWAFGLVAKKTGQGEAKARVRSVVCETGTARCTSTTVEVKAVVQVG